MPDRDLEDLYNKHFRSLYRFFYYKILSRETAEDLTSDTFMRFVEMTRGKTLAEIRNPVKYLYGIAKLVLIKHLKEKYNSIHSIPIEAEQDFGSYVEDYLQEIDDTATPEELALKYIEQLPDKQKTVLRLRLIEKLSLHDICARLDKNMNYVKTTQKRGLHNLKLLFAAGQCTPE